MDRSTAAVDSAEECDAGIETDQDMSDTQETTSPSATKRRAPGPKWTAAKDATLLDLKNNQGKTHKEAGEILGRTGTACSTRYQKLRKAPEAVAAAAPGGSAADPLEVEDATTPGGQVDDQMEPVTKTASTVSAIPPTTSPQRPATGAQHNRQNSSDEIAISCNFNSN